ncbi:hypothetical protein M406DRAFT_342021 [Cryphonectria parasitica EP155]|uniref:DUF1996 domain-containing protein n=1 Tax=Cryphonectria parasitica (strain ATCC 38755 / EP155) TaxID=660469 RepID=A0A9P5CM48_CRYP1|nr:uncharacterized protein M406DRAFT_342021 [Cryphonectria parasitica EP155]KAF3762902.1 hypothetical protein M406DRAFT_342021 [Cryphonectria parasitica EP155]
MAWSQVIGLLALSVLGTSSPTPQIGGGGAEYTMLRFGCAQVVIDRLDPLVSPGSVPSGHVHQIVGGNAFNATMTTGDVSDDTTCTTCAFSQDRSNYWTANMYFKASNGSYHRVPQGGAAYQFNDNFSTQIGGGILVYYVSYPSLNITAFKPGFRMLVGDYTRRTNPGSTLKYQNCFRCYTGPNYGGDTSAPCQGSNDYQGLPPQACPGGIRSNILFPTCWDGVNLDTPNHQDHVAYPTSGPTTFIDQPGECPSTHPVRIPQVMFEVVWNTTQYNDEWPTDGSQPFYLSYGDNTGYGQHADYVFGWQNTSLQGAMDVAGCMGATCSQANLLTQDINTAKECTVKKEVNEDEDGWMSALPGQSM